MSRQLAIPLALVLCAGSAMAMAMAMAGELSVGPGLDSGPQPHIGGPLIVGTARVVDGDTIDVAHVRIRLSGIDAPERAQVCSGYPVLRSNPPSAPTIACGEIATERMRDLADGREATCLPLGRDKYGRTVATCGTAATPDLGAAMVRAGWAVRWPRYDTACRYCEADAEARRARRGLWAGAFEMPWEWRHREKEER